MILLFAKCQLKRLTNLGFVLLLWPLLILLLNCFETILSISTSYLNKISRLFMVYFTQNTSKLHVILTIILNHIEEILRRMNRLFMMHFTLNSSILHVIFTFILNHIKEILRRINRLFIVHFTLNSSK